MSLQIPSQYRILNYWEYVGEQAPEDFNPNDPSLVNADWVMRMFDMIVDGQFATKSFNVVSSVADLPVGAEKGQTAYILNDNNYMNSFFIYNGTSWINPIKMVEQEISTATQNISYTNITNKPQINNVELGSGDNTLSALGIQGKNLYFSNIGATNWVSDSTYNDYGYKCVLDIPGVDENMFAMVVFAPNEFDSGNYANVCLTDEDTITIYSKVNSSITIPTIVVMGA